MKNIERIVFDFDNTLIIWKKEYLKILREIIIRHGIVCNENDLNEAIGETVNYAGGNMTIDKVIKQALSLCSVQIGRDFVDDWFKALGERTIDLEDDIVDTLEYLQQKKYDMVVLSNFNGHVQRARAHNAGILKYFTAIYGSDMCKMKPHPSSYQLAIGQYPKEACVMVGDNIREDYMGAISFGMNAIFLDRKGQHETGEGITVIHRIKELKKML